MSKQITMTYCGVSGTGSTVKEAKLDATRKIEAMMADGFDPYIVSHPAHTTFAIVFRYGVEGWAHKLIDEHPRCGRVSGYGMGRDSFREAVNGARRHLAQITCEVENDLRSGLEWLLDPYDMREHIRWLAWQRTYRKFHDAGHNDIESHRLACDQTDMSLVAGLTEALTGTKQREEAIA